MARKRMPESMTDRERQAQALGKRAFEDGLAAVPARDPELQKMYGHGDTTRILDAWIRGWHRANAEAPVPGLGPLGVLSRSMTQTYEVPPDVDAVLQRLAALRGAEPGEVLSEAVSLLDLVSGVQAGRGRVLLVKEDGSSEELDDLAGRKLRLVRGTGGWR